MWGVGQDQERAGATVKFTWKFRVYFWLYNEKQKRNTQIATVNRVGIVCFGGGIISLIDCFTWDWQIASVLRCDEKSLC